MTTAPAAADPAAYAYEFVRLAPHRHNTICCWVVFPHQGKATRMLAYTAEPAGFVAQWFAALRPAPDSQEPDGQEPGGQEQGE